MKATRILFLAIFCLGLTSFKVSAQSQNPSEIYVYYSHLNTYNVKVGDHVEVGDVVGGAGYSGYMTVKNVHLHLAMGIYPPDLEASRVDKGISQNTDWVDPTQMLKTHGYSYQPGTVICGAPFGGNNPAGGQAFHNATDHCGYKMNDPVTAVMPGTVVWTAWWPPSREARDSGHGRVVVVKVTLSQPFAGNESATPYVITQYADMGEFILDTPTPLSTDTPIVQIPHRPEVPASNGSSVFLMLAVAGLLLLGGVMLIASASEQKRGLVKAIVILIWILGIIVIGFSVHPYSLSPGNAVAATNTPSASPTPLPDTFAGTGGGQMELTWDDPALDVLLSQDVQNPPQATTGSSISPVFMKFAVGQLWANQIVAWGKQNGIDPDIIATFVLVESGGNPLAHCPGDKLGYHGASDDRRDHGLFQLNPAYFGNSCDFDSNVSQGVAYIKSRISAANGNLAAAAAGYNGGPMALNWFLTSTDSKSAEYQKAKSEYITSLNKLGYDGPSKAAIVETYVSRILGVYSAAKSNSTLGLEPFLSEGSYAGSVMKAYGFAWPPQIP